MLAVHHEVLACVGGGQDRAAAWVVPGRATLVVADGAGGTGGGAEAAEAVRGALERWHGAPDGTLVALLARLDARLAAGLGEATCVAVAWEGDELRGASVGDSGAWLVGPDRVVELTGRQVRKPLLGSGRAVPVGFFVQPGGDRLVLASDGLFKYAPRERILAVVRGGPLAAIPGRLAALARLPGGGLPDDLAVLVAERAG